MGGSTWGNSQARQRRRLNSDDHAVLVIRRVTVVFPLDVLLMMVPRVRKELAEIHGM
jgi:hypothetical protein